MKNALFSAFLLSFLLGHTQEKAKGEYNRWSLEVNAGNNKAVKPFAAGNYSSDPTKYFYFNGVQHYDIGARYMFSNLFGLKLDFAYDQVKNLEGSGSLPFETQQNRLGLQGVVNLSRVLRFETFTNRFGLLVHAGVQVSTLTPQLGINKDVTEDNGGIMFGLTPQVRINKWIALTGDFTVISNVRQHFNWDGTYSASDNNLSGLLYNTSLGLTFYLGKKEKHADWYLATDKLKGLSSKDDEARVKIAEIEKMLEDTDRDGVPDYRDAENNTPAGIAVDAKGRFIDLNKNGVADELERKSTIEDKVKEEAQSQDIAQALIEKGYVNVFFDVNKDNPNNGSTNNMFQIIEYLRTHPQVKVTLKGFADVRGDEAKNLDLSKRRAQNVFDIISASGIEASRITIAGEGVDASYPNTKTGLDLARRVSVSINK